MAAITVGKIAGVPVRLHFTFLLVLPLFAWWMAVGYFNGGRFPDAEAWAYGTALAIGLFGSVLIHEAAHTIVAVRSGIKVSDITLLPIGGVSRFEQAPRDARTELRVTAVGPLTNFVLAAPLLLIGYFVLAGGIGRFVQLLGLVNLTLGVFNLFVPAFPMDGGRILRALLSRRLGHVRATVAAAGVGKGIAVLLGILGLLGGGILLIVIAVFVYLGAEAEQRLASVEGQLAGLTARDLASSPVDGISDDASMEDALAQMARARHVHLAVLKSDAPVGVLELSDVARVPPAQRAVARVGDLVEGSLAAVEPSQPAADVARQIAERGGRPVLVMDGHDLVGIVTATDVDRIARVAGVRAVFEGPFSPGRQV